MAVIAQTPNKNRNLNHDLYQKANYISTKLTDQLWSQTLVSLVIFLCYDFNKLGLVMNGLSLWTLYTVKFDHPEAISLHVILGSFFLISSSFISMMKLVGLIFWIISFKSLQQKHHGRIKNDPRRRIESFNVERNITNLTAQVQSIMKPLLRVGRKKLGITPEAITGRPLFILNEIYSTEKTYVKNLEALVYVYQEPMKVICNYEDGFLSKQSIHIIFQHLKLILNLHQKQLSAMQTEVKNGHVNGLNMNPFLIGNYSGEILESYSHYMKAFDKKTEELEKLKKNEKFCSFLTSQLLNEKCNGQPIDALLIRPIQRIPSLLLLYKDLYKELTQIDSLYSFDVGEVVNQLNAVLSKLNHEKGMDEGHQRLLIMSQTIENFPTRIVSSQRIATDKVMIQVEQDGNLDDYRITKGKTKLNLYILTDLIVITKLKQKGLMTKTSKELYLTTITHDSISRIFKISEKSNGFGFEYSTSSDGLLNTLVFSTIDFSNSIVDKLLELMPSMRAESITNDKLKELSKQKSPTKGVKRRGRSKSVDRGILKTSQRSSVNIEI